MDTTDGPSLGGYGDFYRVGSDQLCQGDILAPTVVYRADAAPIRVEKTVLPGDRTVWSEAEAGKHLLLPAAPDLPLLIVTHDCAIDKQLNNSGLPPDQISERDVRERSSKTDVLACPIRPVPSTWDNAKFEQVAQGKVLHQFLLPPVDSLGWNGGYADLRWIVTYRLSDLSQLRKIVTLQPDGVALLQTRMASFLSWRE